MDDKADVVRVDVTALGDKRLDALREELRLSLAGGVPGGVLVAGRGGADAAEPVRSRKGQQRNERCACGSGKKFKACCGRRGR